MRQFVQQPVVKNVGLNPAFLPKNSLTADSDRVLVSAEFDDYRRLVLTFNTGERIITKPLPESDINQSVSIAVNPLFDYIQFNTEAEVDLQPGMLAWNQQDRTLDLRLQNDATLQIGMEMYCPPLLNNTGVTIPSGTLVYATGGDINSGRITIAPAQATEDFVPFRVLGVATEDILNGQLGIVTNFGLVRQLNTTGSLLGETWNTGDELYVSSVTPGALTNTLPLPPALSVPVAFVGVVSPTNGNIFVNILYVPTPDFGDFFSTQIQTQTSINTAKAVTFNNTGYQYGVSLNPTFPSRIQIEKTGVFEFTYTFQVKKNNSSVHYIWVWHRLNGVDIPNSATKISISGGTTELAPSSNSVRIMQAGDYFELMWAADSLDIWLDAQMATSFSPATSSVRMTVSQVNEA